MRLMAFAGLIAAATAAPCIAAAPVTGIWMGSQAKDPITDKQSSLAFTYDKGGHGGIALRCHSGSADILINTNDLAFSVGESKAVSIMFGNAEAITVDAVATEPTMLAVRHKSDAKLFKPFTGIEPIIVRFSGLYGREITLQFQARVLPNSLQLVGRVLADCNIAPYPEVEITKATDDLKGKAADGERLRSKNKDRRSR
jgi:hypothetical protein